MNIPDETVEAMARAHTEFVWRSNGLEQLEDRTWELQRSQRIDAFRAALALLPEQPASPVPEGWRDIASAPRDGTRVIVGWFAFRDLPQHNELGRFRSGTGPGSGWCNTYSHSFSSDPDVWFPLPTPPAERAKG